MSQIKISVPNDDHVALRAMAKALEEIAVARGAPAQGKQINIDTTQPGLSAARLRECANYLQPQVEVDTTVQQVESLVKFDETATFTETAADTPTTDSTGTPWDERIHSASKALNSDGTWRVRRKPKDMEQAEWDSYLSHIASQINPENITAMKEFAESLSAADLESFDEHSIMKQELNEPSITPAGDDFHVDAGVVTEQEVASIPAPPPPPVVTPAAPAPLSDESYTFPQVMQFLTERHGRITSPQVDQIIADMGLDSIMSIRDNPEHAGPFIARVKALLGE